MPQAGREEIPDVGGQIRFAAGYLGACGAEVHEPVFEEGAGHFLEGPVHFAVEFYFVVEGSEDVGYGALFG